MLNSAQYNKSYRDSSFSGAKARRGKASQEVEAEPHYNAETLAALEEGMAIMRGEIAAKTYNSLQEILDEVDADIAAENAGRNA